MNLRESTRVTANTYMSPRCDRLINKYEGGWSAVQQMDFHF
jgi:hypothetical protein